MKRYFYNKQINKVNNLQAYENGKTSENKISVFNFAYNQYHVEIFIAECSKLRHPLYGYVSNATNSIQFDFTEKQQLQVYDTDIYFSVPATLSRMIYKKCRKLLQAVLQMKECTTTEHTGILELKGNKITVYQLADAVMVAGGLL